jgi:tRNA threonylcarbamoyladenosine biosynthesis protein TsaE
MRICLEGEAAQLAFGQRLCEWIRPPCVIYLDGDLGTGKTTLTRGIVRGLGHAGPVRSPTYTLHESYELRDMRLHHLDLYRLGDPQEVEFLGLRDLLDEQDVLIVEWPQRGQGVLPPPDLSIRLEHQGSGRVLDLIRQSLSCPKLEPLLGGNISRADCSSPDSP